MSISGYPLERIVWLDHRRFVSAQWATLQELEELQPVRLETVGFVVKETKEYIVIVSTLQMTTEIDIDAAATSDFLVLKSTILSRETLVPTVKVSVSGDNRGEKHGNSRLTEAEVLEIRQLKGFVTQVELARSYGVSTTTVGKIQRGELWLHLA